MQLGDKDTKRMVKKKFDVVNARQRDPAMAITHSYKSKLNYPMQVSKKWRLKQKNSQRGSSSDFLVGSGLQASKSQLSVPVLVQYQNALIREENKVSPFMEIGPPLDPDLVTIEPPKKKSETKSAVREED